jgi:hypothetical protein
MNNINQISGHGLICLIYLIVPFGYMWARTIKEHESPVGAFLLVTLLYVTGHLISAGVIK